MKNVATAIVCFALSLAVFTPSLNAQKRKAKPSPATVTVPAPSPLDPTLSDLDRVSAATISDLSDLKSEKHSRSWMTAWMFWRHETSNSEKTQQLAASLQRNLHDAVPGLIEDARTGSFKATFKLYNDLSVVCELLDSLVDSMKADGRKSEGPLNHDAAAMGRIRQDLATFVEQKAAALDGTRPVPNWTAMTVIPAANGKPKKIIVDDNIPSKPEKKTIAAQP